MIKATCLCGSTFETSSNYQDSNTKRMVEWLGRHQDCVNMEVVCKQHAIRQTEKITWPSGHQMVSPSYTYRARGIVKCLECGYQQPEDGAPVHADNCNNTDPVPTT